MAFRPEIAPVPGVDRRPYVEVDDYDYSEARGWTDELTGLALTGAGIYGPHWALNNVKITADPSKYTRYLSEGFSGDGSVTPFRAVAGMGDSGQAQVPLKVFLLESLKRSEELAGGIPRTFGVVDYMSSSVLTSAESTLQLPGEHVSAHEFYYESVLGRPLTTHERKMGFTVAPYTQAQLEAGFPSTHGELSEAGQATGRRPGLFTTEAAGPGRLVLPDVDIHAVRWSPPGVNEGYQQAMMSPRLRAQAMGTRIGRDEFPFTISKARGEVRLGRVSRSVLRDLGISPDEAQEFMARGVSPRTQRSIEIAEAVSKNLATRYLKILDQPLEFIEETINRPDALNRVKGSRGYKLFTNIFGTGGDYSGTLLDMTARHAARIGTLAIGGALAYEGVSRVTDFLFDRDASQVGMEAVGAAQRIYAGLSETTGLTALNKMQQEEAFGSHRLLGVLAFPMSGYLTGRIAGGIVNRAALKEGEFGWRAARAETHRLPRELSALSRLEGIPGFGDISKSMTRGRLYGKIGGAIGGALSLPFLLGAFGSEQTFAEVTAERRGETEVAVRKGALWEMGRTDIEGERIQYYDEGAYRRAFNEGAEELQQVDLGGRPFTRMLRGLVDPYWKEKELYEDRPYPVTGPDTSGFGPLGTIWGMTVGRVLKPVKFMHAEEASPGGVGGLLEGEAFQYGSRAEEAASMEHGGLGPMAAVSPYSAGFLSGELAYKTTEAIGLPGFVFSAVKDKITGSPDFGDTAPVLESFAGAASLRESFWDLNIGGGYTTTEALRRFIPPERHQLQKQNPIPNTMPSWMPGPDYYMDFRHGDPYAKVPRGERRLPGPGFEDRFPELEGVHPEDYPNIYRYKILADVAPYSRQFRTASKIMAQQVAEGDISERDYSIYKATQKQLEERARLKEFRREPDSLIGEYWAGLTSLARRNPVEHFLPFSPVHKFAGPTDPSTSYEMHELYSPENPYWGNPIEDFLKPGARVAASLVGAAGIPGEVQERRDLIEYFDKLEYTKYKRLQTEAEKQGETQAAFAYGRRAEKTMYGADPYREVGEILRVLPRTEQAYFEAFLDEQDPSARGKILSMVPSYTKKFYVAQWKKQMYGHLAAQEAQSSSERELMEGIEMAQDFEGQPVTTSAIQDFLGDYHRGRVTETDLPDYIRGQRLEHYFDDGSPYDLPADDWLGWDPQVSLDDVKLRVVQNQGADYHDFELWEEREAGTRRKPYLNQAANELMHGGGADTSQLRQLLTSYGVGDVEFDVVHGSAGGSRIMLEVERNRQHDIRGAFGG